MRTACVKGNKQNAYVFLNFGKKPISFENPIEDAKFLVSTSVNSNPIQEEDITLMSQEGIALLK